MRLNKITLILTLLMASYSIFAPLEAWIDHFFDFHFDLDRVKEGSKQEGFEKDGVWYEHEAFYEAYREADRERESDSGRGTNTNTPDRDK